MFDTHLINGSIDKKDRVRSNLVVALTKEEQAADGYIVKAASYLYVFSGILSCGY